MTLLLSLKGTSTMVILAFGKLGLRVQESFDGRQLCPHSWPWE